jgi:hypothetical protein
MNASIASMGRMLTMRRGILGAMVPRRRLLARLDEVTATPAADPRNLESVSGVALVFRNEGGRRSIGRIDDFACLDAAESVESALGIGKVLRLLRAARIAPPRSLDSLKGDPTRAAELLRRALGTCVHLEVRPRSRVRFTVWTESGVESVTDVAEVLEDESAYLILRLGGRFPVRLPREQVVRHRTESETWYEVVSIERA